MEIFHSTFSIARECSCIILIQRIKDNKNYSYVNNFRQVLSDVYVSHMGTSHHHHVISACSENKIMKYSYYNLTRGMAFMIGYYWCVFYDRFGFFYLYTIKARSESTVLSLKFSAAFYYHYRMNVIIDQIAH